jgi:hypothetical protein
MFWRAQYGRWNFLRDMGGIHRIRYSLHCFIYFYLRCKVYSYLVNKKITFLKKSHFPTELVTFCFWWPHYTPPHAYHPLAQMPASVSNSFSWFIWSWVEGPLVLGCRPLSAANWLSCSKALYIQPFYLSPTVPQMAVVNEICPQQLPAITLPVVPAMFGYKPYEFIMILSFNYI